MPVGTDVGLGDITVLNLGRDHAIRPVSIVVVVLVRPALLEDGRDDAIRKLHLDSSHVVVAKELDLHDAHPLAEDGGVDTTVSPATNTMHN